MKFLYPELAFLGTSALGINAYPTGYTNISQVSHKRALKTLCKGKSFYSVENHVETVKVPTILVKIFHIRLFACKDADFTEKVFHIYTVFSSEYS